MAAKSTPNDLLTTAEAAAHLSVPLGTLALWRGSRTGPDFLKIGRRVMYERGALESFVAACRVECSHRTPSRVAGG